MSTKSLLVFVEQLLVLKSRFVVLTELILFSHTNSFNSQSSVKKFVENTNDVLDRMKLIACDVEAVPAGRSAFRMRNLFLSCMSDLATSIAPICDNFS